MEIDITTLIWTIISFLLFCVILNKLLYKPLVGFMDKRDARIQEGLKKEQDAKDKLESAQGRMDEKFRQANDEAEAKVREAKQKDRAAYDAQIMEAHELISEKIRQADLYVKAEEQKELDQVDVQLPELVCSLAEKILGESIPVSENSDIVDNHAVRS